jgi:hypothetical protein
MPKRTDPQIMHGIFFDSIEDKETLQNMLWKIKNITGENFPEICINALYKYYKSLREGG